MENREAIHKLIMFRRILERGVFPLGYRFDAEPFDLAISALEKQEQDRWIPVTERLPEDEYVLISKKPTKLSGSKWSVGIGIRTADPRSRKIQWRDSGFGVIQDDKVLACQKNFTENKQW